MCLAGALAPRVRQSHSPDRSPERNVGLTGAKPTQIRHQNFDKLRSGPPASSPPSHLQILCPRPRLGRLLYPRLEFESIMTVMKPRSRMISVRLSEEEYSALIHLCSLRSEEHTSELQSLR